MPNLTSLRSLFNPKSKRRVRRSTRRRRLVEALEDRRLLTANLNLLADGRLIFGGSSVPNDLEVSFTAGEYTFSDPSEPVNAVGLLAGLDTNVDPNIVTFDAATAEALTTGGSLTSIIINPNDGDDTTTITSFRDGLAGGEGLDIREDAGEGNDTVNINGDIGSGANPVGNQVLIRGENLNLGADVFSTSNIVFGGDVELTDDATVDTDATAEFQANIDGAFALSAEGDSVQVAGDIGGVTPLTSVDFDAGDQIQASGDVSATGDIDLTAATDIILGGDLLAGGGGLGSVDVDAPLTAFTGPTSDVSSSLAAADSVSFSGDLTSGAGTDLTISSGLGPASIGGQAAGFGDFNVASSDTTDIDGVVAAEDIEVNATTSLNAEGFQASAGDVDINTPSTVFDGPTSTLNSATGTIDFSGTIVGNFDDLLFRGATSVSVAGAVTDVGLFDARRGGGLLFTEVAVNAITAGEIIIEADNSTILLSGDLISAGDITLFGRTEVLADISLLSGGTLGDDIVIFGSVHDTSPGTRTLILDAGAGAVQNLPLPPDVGIGVGGDFFFDVRVTGGLVTLFEVAVLNDLIIEGGVINLNGPLSGLGDMIFRPRLAGGTLNIFNSPTVPPIPDMTLAGTQLAFVVPGFTNVIFGGPTAGAIFVFPGGTPPDPVVGALDLGALDPTNTVRFEAPLVGLNEEINQGGVNGSPENSLLFVVDQLDLNFGGTFVGTGDINIEDFGIADAITVNGALGQPVASLLAGNSDVNVNAPASDVTFTGNIGHRVDSLFVDSLTADFPAPTAVNPTGDFTTTGDTSLNGGIFSVAGSVNVGGTLELLGNSTLLIPGGQDVTVQGDVVGNGNNLVVRGRGGPIDTVDILGDVTNVGRFAIDSGGANVATTVAIEGVEADDIVIRGLDIEIEGTLEARTGNLHLIGAVSLFGNSSLENTSGVATNFVRVDGTIDDFSIGGADLNIDSGPGTTVLTGAIGGISPLDNMTVFSTGLNFITQPIEVLTDFEWTVGLPGNTLNDRLFIVGATVITAGNDITLEADQVVGDVVGVNLIAGNTITILERGLGD